ncbi:MAG: chromosomal replication initiator protein DnaA [Ignavibacteria bacterium]
MIKHSTAFEQLRPSASIEDLKAIEVWDKFLELLKLSLKDSEIKTWFSVIKPKSFSDGVLTILVPSEDYYGMIERRFNKQISSIIESGLLGQNGKLKYEIVQESLFTTQEQELTHKNVSNPPKKGLPPHKNISITYDEKNNFESNLFKRFTFDTFVKGDSNEYAYSTAVAISNNPGKLYNPYFVFGAVGLGKTHLIQAIGNEIIKKFPNKKVFYTTTPDFTTQITTGIYRNTIKEVDLFYKSLDVLILDDIQNLEGKPGIQNFVYQIFNTLYNNNKHLIFSSDKPIIQVKNLEERLISRFQWGITVDIQPPDWEMRVAIIKRKLEEFEVQVPEDIIHFIATNVKGSIRPLEGCIVGIISESTFMNNGEVTFEIAEKVVKRVVGDSLRPNYPSIEDIIQAVAKYFEVSENQILSRKRTKQIALSRQVAMYLSKELTNLTLESIGLNFGGKDHATVLYAYNSIKKLLQTDKDLAKAISDIKANLNGV